MDYKEPIPDKNYKLIVRCITFNHSNYIEDALKGFIIQKTSFPFICIILDDCSTDGEQSVIRGFLDREFDMNTAKNYVTEYATIIKASHKRNKNCTFCVYFLKYNHYSRKESIGKYLHLWRNNCKYEALCEGDDYWISPNKLQDQFTILENNNDALLVCSDFETVDEKGNKIEREAYRQYSTISSLNSHLLQLLKDNYIMTLTCCYRINIIESRQYKDAPAYYDYTLFLTAALLGNIIYMPGKTGAYRRSPNGLMETARDKVNLDLFAIREYFFFEIVNHHHDYNLKCKDLWNIRVIAIRYGLGQLLFRGKWEFLCNFIKNDIISIFLIIPLFVEKLYLKLIKRK